MFLTCCSPMFSNTNGSRSRTWSWTVFETRTPPGSANASSRAATFTPSPKMSCSSTITSPRLIPTRNSILLRRGARVALGHAPLHLRGAPHGINHARELGKEAVARILHDPPPVLGDLRLDQVPE